jgi:Tol biopolymer transport system component
VAPLLEHHGLSVRIGAHAECWQRALLAGRQADCGGSNWVHWPARRGWAPHDASVRAVRYAKAATFTELPGIASVAWSPDGTRLVAERNGDLVLLTRTGGQEGMLAVDGASPDWSSRGQIAFARKDNIWTVRPGQAAKQLTHRGGSSPSWSPDGRYLAFVRASRIFIVRRDGRQLRRFLSRRAGTPVWSPSGRSLAFISNYDLYAARADGTRLRRLLNYDPPLFRQDLHISIEAMDWRPLPK